MIRLEHLATCGALVLATMLSGCADLIVTHVDSKNNQDVQGQRYYLPKPEIVVAPQTDGSVSVTVDYLPDQDHEYAIDTSSTLSSYTYQVQTDIHGFLTEVEFKADTTAVDQQLASSASAAAVQYANYQASQAVANQTAVNTAQAAVDTAQATVDAAQAALDSDRAHLAGATALAVDASALAQAQAKLVVAKAALDRTKASSQAVALGATAGTVATTAGPTMGTMIGNTPWTGPSAIGLPANYAPVVFLLNDDAKYDAGGNLTGAVTLVAQTGHLDDTGTIPDDQLENGVSTTAQPTFEVSLNALPPPSLLPASQTVPKAAKTVEFKFDRAIKAAVGMKVTTAAAKPVQKDVKIQLQPDNQTVAVDTTPLAAGDYVLSLNYSYTIDTTGAPGGTRTASATVKFTLTK